MNSGPSNFLIPEIETFFKDCPNIELEIPCDLNWKSDDWLYSEIKKFDIGISPIIDHPFNEAKSAFKAKQYLSVGVPTIASDVGENRVFVEHRKNGLLCKNGTGFISLINYIDTLDDDAYFEMSNYALEKRNKFSVGNYCKVLIDRCN